MRTHRQTLTYGAADMDDGEEPTGFGGFGDEDGACVTFSYRLGGNHLHAVIPFHAIRRTQDTTPFSDIPACGCHKVPHLSSGARKHVCLCLCPKPVASSVRARKESQVGVLFKSNPFFCSFFRFLGNMLIRGRPGGVTRATHVTCHTFKGGWCEHRSEPYAVR